MQIDKEQLQKAIAAKSVEELLEMAKAEGLSVTGEEAEYYFKVLHAEPDDAGRTELSENELENVVGGTCYSDGVTSPQGVYRQYAIVSPYNVCPHPAHKHNEAFCAVCSNHFVVGGTWYCNQRWKGHDTMRLYPGEYHWVDD